MSEDSASRPAVSLRLPATSHELWALLLAIVAVFLLVQVGAPIIRTFEFLDPKLRDYFIGISFAAFPVIHRGAKQTIQRFDRDPEPVRMDSAPWFVAGVMAAAVIFGWNQFVSFLSGMSIGVLMAFMSDSGLQQIDQAQLSTAVTTASVVIVLPLSAVAAVYAGILINRHTRSHPIAAVGLASVMFITINTLMTWFFEPAMIEQIVAMIMQGGADAISVVIGMGSVGLIIFLFAVAGVFISRFRHDRPVGRIVEAARRLPPSERDALATELARRVDTLAAASAAASAPPPAPPVPPTPRQMPTIAEP